MTSTERLRVGLVVGGRSGEHAVSLMSARSVMRELDPEKYDIVQIGITQEGMWLTGDDVLDRLTERQLDGLSPVTVLADPTRHGLFKLTPGDHGEILERLTEIDVIFPVLHGSFGEDGTFQGLLEMAGVAYVGAGVLGSALAMDKGVFKDIMRAHGIPVVESIVVTRNDIDKQLESVLEQAEEVAPYPLFTKPANLGSSVGITKCKRRADLVEGLLEAAQYDRRILVERGVNGREIELSVLGNEHPLASVPGEVIPAAEFYTYEAKYHDNRSKLVIPASLSPGLTAEIQDYAIRAYHAIDCAGMARADFLLDRETQQPFLNEFNTIPGFTQISMYPKLWEASGVPYPRLLDRLIDLALERKAERDRTVWHYNRDSS